MNLNQNFEPIEPERPLTPAHATNRCGIRDRQDLVCLWEWPTRACRPGPRANQVLLSELDGPCRKRFRLLQLLICSDQRGYAASCSRGHPALLFDFLAELK